jgi:hypothetical protein
LNKFEICSYLKFVQIRILFKIKICSNSQSEPISKFKFLKFQKIKQEKTEKRKKQRRSTTWSGPTPTSRRRSGVSRANARRVGAPNPSSPSNLNRLSYGRATFFTILAHRLLSEHYDLGGAPPWRPRDTNAWFLIGCMQLCWPKFIFESQALFLSRVFAVALFSHCNRLHARSTGYSPI